MVLEILAVTLDFLGKILIAVTALLVHRRIKKRHKIDKKVLKEMKLEQSVGFIAIIFLVAAYILHLYIL